MPETLQELDEQAPVVSHRAALEEDAYWQRSYWQERYYWQEGRRWSGLEYEDYAPAYCVGYIGCAQYGGEFAEAERSLCANWERIKSDSRLSLEQAMPAIPPHGRWSSTRPTPRCASSPRARRGTGRAG